MAELDIAGLAELERNLRDFAPQIQKRALDSGLRAAGKAFVEEIKGRVQDDPVIAHGMRIRQSRKAHRRSATHLVIGWLRRTGGGARAAWREFGTRAHVIKPRRAKALADPGTGAFFGGEVHHPGQQARPFIRPALKAAAPRAIEAMRKQLARYIARQYKRAAKAG